MEESSKEDLAPYPPVSEISPTLPAIVRLLPGFIKRRVAQRPSVIKILDNIGWLFFDKILRMGVGLIVGAWVAQYLEPEQYGILSYALAFVSLFSALAGLGLQGIVVRDIVRDPSCKDTTLGTAAIMLLVASIVSYGLVLSVIFMLRAEDSMVRLLVAIVGLVILFKFSDVVLYWFEAKVQSKYAVWVQNGVFLIFATFKIGLLLSKAPLVMFAWITAAESMMVAIVLLWMFRIRGHKLRQLRIGSARAFELFKDSWPLMLSGMVLMIQARIDQVMLGQLVGDYEVAQYSVALRIIETATVGSTIIQSTFMPDLIAAKNDSQEIYLKKLCFFYKLSMLIGIALAIVVAISSFQIINVLFGRDYLPAAQILKIMAFRIILCHIGVARGTYLLSENLLKYATFTMILGTIINIMLNYILIPIHGAVGATVASLISFSVTIFGIDLVFNKTRKNIFLIFKSAMNFVSMLK